MAGIREPIGSEHERGPVGKRVDPHGHDRHDRLRRLGGGHALEDVGTQLVNGDVQIVEGTQLERFGVDIATLDFPASCDRLTDEAEPFDHEDALLITRTAAPQEAPQPLNPGVRVGEPFAQRAALAASVKAANAAASVTARSASILRSISMPAALRPA